LFQAEDGIRSGHVTGVQTCALPISRAAHENRGVTEQLGAQAQTVVSRAVAHASSAEQVTAATEQQGASTQEMAAAAGVLLQAAEIGRASCRERVEKSVVAGVIEKKK